MTKRWPRVSSGPRDKNGWKAKVHPFFIGTAEYQRKVSILSRSENPRDQEEAQRLTKELPEELVREAERLHDEMKPAGKIRHAVMEIVMGVDGLPPGTEVPQAYVVMHHLCWFRYNKTLTQLKAEYDAGNLKAARQIHKLSTEYDEWRLGGLNPNKLKFKTDVEHFNLMSAGFDLGIEKLTPVELADCFDELCSCGNPHYPENLAKFRARILRLFPPREISGLRT